MFGKHFEYHAIILRGVAFFLWTRYAILRCVVADLQ